MKTAPNWKSLVKKAEKPLRRDIRRTHRPIFNLVRLVKAPCGEFGCEMRLKHADKPTLLSGFSIVALTFGVGCLLFAASGILNRRDLILFLGGSIVLLISGMYGLYSCAWSTHVDELKERRQRLTTKLKECQGRSLVASLNSTIKEAEDHLFGEKSEFQGWTQQLEDRAKEIGATSELVIEPVPPGSVQPYRGASEITRVRVVIEKEDFASAFARHRAFRESAQKRLDKLRAQSVALGKSVDDLNRLLAKPNTRRDAVAQLATIEASIQRGTEVVYAELNELSDETQSALAGAAQAATASYSVDAQKAADVIFEPDEAGAPSSVDAEKRRFVP